MKVLPNGVTVFNATPHAITFWREDWDEVVIVESDEIISAVPEEKPHSCLQPYHSPDYENVWLVETVFTGNENGREIVKRAREAGAEIIIGSIIAAQAYRGDVSAMIPCEGYERVPPAEKRMRPDKFTTYPRMVDGIYAIQNGNQVKVDSFTWGYEGLARTEHSAVIKDSEGQNVLFAGPGMPEEKLVDFRQPANY